jgi:penicillin-insensitive murein endopeptidase
MPRMASLSLVHLLLLGAGLTPSASAAQAIEVVRVTTPALNLRAGASTSAAILGQLLQGHAYPALERSGEWVRLQVDGRTGWSHRQYLAQDPTALGVRYVLRDQVNVRAGPGTGYRVVGQLLLSTPVAVAAASAGWAQVWFRSQAAWIWAGNLGTAPPANHPPRPPRPRSAAGFIQLPASGPGFESYTTASRRWGRPELVYGLERAAARWVAQRRDRMGIGDMSLANGGHFPPHSSHRLGRDVDLALVRVDGRELPVSIHDAQYSRLWTGRMLALLRQEIPTGSVLFNDQGLPGVTRFPGHDDHVHLSLRN